MSVTYETVGRVAVISIDHPERRNAIDRATAEGLAEMWRRFDRDGNADVAVLTSAGDDSRPEPISRHSPS